MMGRNWSFQALFKILVPVCCLVGAVGCADGGSEDGSKDAAVDDRDTATTGDVRDTEDASKLDAGRPDVQSAYSDFQFNDVCREEGREKPTLFIKGETYVPQRFDGCVRVQLVKNGQATESGVMTPKNWAYTSGRMDADRCISFDTASSVSATSAFGTIDMETNEQGEPSMVEYDILLEFPTNGSNPYGQYVRLHWVDDRPFVPCITAG
jgi:hypothetical protein